MGFRPRWHERIKRICVICHDSPIPEMYVRSVDCLRGTGYVEHSPGAQSLCGIEASALECNETFAVDPHLVSHLLFISCSMGHLS